MNRRGFLTGLAGIVAAPAIVRVANIMPVSVLSQEPTLLELMRRAVLMLERNANPPVLLVSNEPVFLIPMNTGENVFSEFSRMVAR